jgi:3-deoxy-7-phosphoheptulonate synthase
MADWNPACWRDKPAKQQPAYPSEAELAEVAAQLASLPPLVTSWEVVALKSQLAEAAAGKRFLLQGGDCAERFDDCEAGIITNKLKILLQMSLVLIQGSKMPVIRVGRFGGQYAKPRSDDNETREGRTLPSYRGDVVNRPEFTEAGRRADPQLLIKGYGRSALTLNFVRALVKGGFADLHHPEYWDLDWVKHSPMASEYGRMVDGISESLRFMESVLGMHVGELGFVDFFTSHEGLLLIYEESQTRRVPHREGWWNLSTHFPWIGMRTADPDGAHVEYFRGIENPIGVKIGPATTRESLLRLLDLLQPRDEPGRLTFIHRFGIGRIGELLPGMIDTVRASGKNVLWVCDPMHGNTRLTAGGIKTRHFSDILGELEQAFEIHAECGSTLGGVHIELTGDNVTECVGGARGLSEDDLRRAYRSEVDPRLNYEQALEMAMLIARKMQSLG